jgi:hypothetical protein
MDSFKEWVNENASGLMSIRPLRQGGNPSGPTKVINPDNSLKDKIFHLLLAAPMSMMRGIVDFANMLKHMGFTGNPDSLKAAIKLGKLAVPPAIYAFSKMYGLPAPGLIAMIASPQFWQAYQRIGQTEKEGSPMPLAREHQSAQEQSINF